MPHRLLWTVTQSNWPGPKCLGFHAQPGLTALTDYLADPSDTTYQQAFIAAAALTSGAGGGPGSQAWSVVLAPAQLLNYMAVATNPAGRSAGSPPSHSPLTLT